MKQWLMTQFNTIYCDDPTFQQNFALSSIENWQETPQFLRKKEILCKKIPKNRIEELRWEISELKQLQSDMQNADHSNMKVQVQSEEPPYELQLEDILNDEFADIKPREFVTEDAVESSPQPQREKLKSQIMTSQNTMRSILLQNIDLSADQD